MPVAPVRIEHVTPEWLTGFLAVEHPDVRVDDIEITERTQGAATRLRLRLRYAAGHDAGLPEEMFLKTSLTQRMLVTDPSMYLTEVRYYEHFRQHARYETPQVFGLVVDEVTRRFAVAIEDLAGRDAAFPSALSSTSADDLAPLMSTLAAMHAEYWGQPDLEKRFDWLETARRGPSSNWYLAPDGVAAFDFGLTEEYKPQVLDLARHPRERMARAFRALQVANDTEPRTVIHGDVHIGNTYQLPDGRFGLIDWQLMRIATWANDVAYAVVTALDISERRAREQDLLRHYLDELRARGVEPPVWDDAWRHYRQQMIWGMFTWVVTPTVMYNRELIETLLRRCVTATEDLDTYAVLDC